MSENTSAENTSAENASAENASAEGKSEFAKRPVEHVGDGHKFPENGDPDARKVSELLSEVGEILCRRNWPGVALALCSVSEDMAGAYGFNILSMRDHLLIRSGTEGLALVQAAQILGRR
jgi:hypothetical protein